MKKERERVWREFKNNFYSKDLLIVMQNFGVDEKQAVIKLLNKSLENDKTYSFCVVVRAFLKNIINSKPKIPPQYPRQIMRIHQLRKKNLVVENSLSMRFF